MAAPLDDSLTRSQAPRQPPPNDGVRRVAGWLAWRLHPSPSRLRCPLSPLRFHFGLALARVLLAVSLPCRTYAPAGSGHPGTLVSVRFRHILHHLPRLRSCVNILSSLSRVAIAVFRDVSLVSIKGYRHSPAGHHSRYSTHDLPLWPILRTQLSRAELTSLHSPLPWKRFTMSSGPSNSGAKSLPPTNTSSYSGSSQSISAPSSSSGGGGFDSSFSRRSSGLSSPSLGAAPSAPRKGQALRKQHRPQRRPGSRAYDQPDEDDAMAELVSCLPLSL